MKRPHILIGVALLILVAGGSYFLLKAPEYSALDFENENPVVTQDPSLSQTEIDLRRIEVSERETAREGEDTIEAAADALEDYLNAGLYAEALRVAEDNEKHFIEDPTYFEIKGDLKAAMRQYRDAIEAYARSLELGGDRASIYAKIGELYLFYSTIPDRQDKARSLYSYAASQSSDSETKQELKIKAKSLE